MNDETLSARVRNTAKLDIHILLDNLAFAAKGESLDPEICQTIERIAREYDHKEFGPEEIQALYDCGHSVPFQTRVKALEDLDHIEQWSGSKGDIKDRFDNIRAVLSEKDDGTPAAEWRIHGEPDPHGNRYDCERAKLPFGHMTDDQFANAFYLINHRLALDSERWLDAAKNRIRWLSRKLVEASAAPIPPVDLCKVKETLEGLHSAYVQDIEKAVEIMHELGRKVDPAESMIRHTEKVTGYQQSLDDIKKAMGE